MGLHVYCIVPTGYAPAAGVRGLDGAEVRLIEGAGPGIWASSHSEPPAPDLATVRVHNEIVHGAMDGTVTPVPVRFGQWFSDEDAMVERIAQDAAHWFALLERFAGKAEYGVSIVQASQETARDVRPAAGSTGTAFMQQLAHRQADAAARRHLAEHLADEIAARLSDIEVEKSLETPARGPVVARLAHLVAWRDAETYHAVMCEVRTSRQDVQVRLTGPWPPWSFTR